MAQEWEDTLAPTHLALVSLSEGLVTVFSRGVLTLNWPLTNTPSISHCLGYSFVWRTQKLDVLWGLNCNISVLFNDISLFLEYLFQMDQSKISIFTFKILFIFWAITEHSAIVTVTPLTTCWVWKWQWIVLCREIVSSAFYTQLLYCFIWCNLWLSKTKWCNFNSDFSTSSFYFDLVKDCIFVC